MAKKKESMENKRKVIASANIEDKGPEAQGEGSSSDEELQEEESAELVIEEDWPHWMQMVLEGLGTDDPEDIQGVSDEYLLAVNGVGPATLEEIHAWLNERYPPEEKKPKKVKVRVLPMRGVGGVGQAGTVASIDREYAEELEADGYVDILD